MPGTRRADRAPHPAPPGPDRSPGLVRRGRASRPAANEGEGPGELAATHRRSAELARGLILVCAPAGFGKTTLLADWIRRSGRSVAWLSIDAGDNDPARFWRHAAAALERLLPGISRRVDRLLGPTAPPSFEGLVAALINEVAAQPGEVVLILDDYHLIDSQPVHASLAFLLEHLPRGLQLVLASRSDPPLPLARLRARGQMAELRVAELRFTPDEAATLLSEAVGPNLTLPDTAMAALAARTEGWAAGLQLAALSLRGQTDVAGFVATFSGSHRYILDYLTEEVLELQPEQLRTFLLETSVLERLSGALCDAVTGRTDGQAMLEAIERANLFLVPLDEVRGWWRYHHLFADLLRARLQLQQPSKIPILHRAAASWCERHGLTDDAVRHALGAGDTAWAARMIERHVDGLILRGEQRTVEEWVAELPEELVRSRPRLLLPLAIMALIRVDVEAVEVPLDAAERAFADASDEPFESSVGAAASMVTNVPAAIAASRANLAFLRGDAERATTFAARAQALLGEGEWMMERLTRTNLAMADWLSGRLPQAERAFTSNVAQLQAAGEIFSAAWSGHQLGEVQRALGSLDAALATYRQTLEITAELGQPALPFAGIAYVGMAEVAYQRGELDSARRYVTDGIALCRDLSYAQALATGLSTLAWIQLVEGDSAGALDAVTEAMRLAPSPGLLNPAPTRHVRLLLAQGGVAAAIKWTNERGLSTEDSVSYAREAEYLVLVRVLLAQDRPDQALAILKQVHAAAAAQGRLGSLIEVLALTSLAETARGNEAGAIAVLASALTLAWPQGYIRALADEGPAMGALVGRLLADQRKERSAGRGIPLDYLGRLVRAFDEQAVRSAPPGALRAAQSVPVGASLIEPLSDRELEVLRLLAAGKQNREIADELWVALDTVKKHVSHILVKLGAGNRTQATTRAREIGLLS